MISRRCAPWFTTPSTGVDTRIGLISPTGTFGSRPGSTAYRVLVLAPTPVLVRAAPAFGDPLDGRHNQSERITPLALPIPKARGAGRDPRRLRQRRPAAGRGGAVSHHLGLEQPLRSRLTHVWSCPRRYGASGLRRRREPRATGRSAPRESGHATIRLTRAVGCSNVTHRLLR